MLHWTLLSPTIVYTIHHLFFQYLTSDNWKIESAIILSSANLGMSWIPSIVSCDRYCYLSVSSDKSTISRVDHWQNPRHRKPWDWIHSTEVCVMQFFLTVHLPNRLPLFQTQHASTVYTIHQSSAITSAAHEKLNQLSYCHQPLSQGVADSFDLNHAAFLWPCQSCYLEQGTKRRMFLAGRSWVLVHEILEKGHVST
jgi:hypothetical protein